MIQGFLQPLRQAAVTAKNLFPASPPDHFLRLFMRTFWRGTTTKKMVGERRFELPITSEKLNFN